MKKLSFKLLMGAMLCAASASAGSLTDGQHLKFRHGGTGHGYMVAATNSTLTYSTANNVINNAKADIFTLEATDTYGQFYIKSEANQKYITFSVGNNTALPMADNASSKFEFVDFGTEGAKSIHCVNPSATATSPAGATDYIHANGNNRCVRWNNQPNTSSWFIEFIDGSLDSKTVTFNYQTADGTSLGTSTAEMLEYETPTTAVGTISGSGNAYTVTLPEGSKEFKLYSGQTTTSISTSPWIGNATAISAMTSSYANAHTFIEVPVEEGKFAIYAKGMGKFLPSLAAQANVATLNPAVNPADAGVFILKRDHYNNTAYGSEYIFDADGGNGNFNKRTGLGSWTGCDQGSMFFMVYDEEAFTTNINSFNNNNIAQSTYCVKLAAGKAALAPVATYTDYEQVTTLANAVNALETARFGVASTNIANLIKDVDDAITAVNSMKKLNLASKIAQLKAYPQGTGLGQYDIVSEIATAEAVANDDDATDEEIEAQITAVQNVLDAIGTKLNMPVAGFYRIKSTANNKYISSNTTQGSFGGVATPILAMATLNNSDTHLIWYYDGQTLVNWADGRVIGKYESNSGATWNVFVKDDEKAAATITFGASTTIGSYTLTAPGNKLCADTNNLSIQGGSRSDAWTLEAVTWLPIPVNTDAKYTSVYSPVPLGLGYGSTNRVTPHEGIIADNKFGKKELDCIPANTPVLLEYITGIENGSVFLPVLAAQPALIDLDNETEAESTNHLSGGIYATAKADDKSYYVAGAEADKFTAHTGDYIPGFTAHLAVATANAPEQGHFTISTYDDVTAIVNVEAATPATDAIYDLQGRRVGAAARGIVIINGKKVIR